jgi:hypothetical protein
MTTVDIGDFGSSVGKMAGLGIGIGLGVAAFKHMLWFGKPRKPKKKRIKKKGKKKR